MKINKILVPTDFSEEANNALTLAVLFAEKTGAQVALLHVIDVPVASYADNLSVIGEDMLTDADDTALYKPYMQRLIELTKEKFKEMRLKYPGANIQENVVFDDLSRQLASFVTKDETDLIIIGSKGSSGIEEILVGSNAEKVIRLAKVPVITVKGHKGECPLKNLVFASNFVKVSQKAIDTLKAFQQIFGTRIHFLKVITPNTFETTPDTHSLIEAFAKENQFENYTANDFNFYSEEEGIRVFAEEKKADMIALTTHGRTGIGHILLGSIAEEVANHANIPVMTFNQHFK